MRWTQAFLLGSRLSCASCPDLNSKIAEVGFDPKFGARPIKRVIQKYIEDTLADLMICGQIPEESTVTLSLDPDIDSEVGIPVKHKVTKKKTTKQYAIYKN